MLLENHQAAMNPKDFRWAIANNVLVPFLSNFLLSVNVMVNVTP